MRALRNYRVVLFAALIVSFTPLAVDGAILRTLKIGDRGADVRELQVILNRDAETRVAAIGPGSPGNETEYFGPLTQAAVIKLQQKYAGDILAPIGLSEPTGIVGSQTRLFLLRLAGSGNTPPTSLAPSSGAVARPSVISVTPIVVTKNMEDITITGSNFTPTGNTVFVSSEQPDAFSGILSEDGRIIHLALRIAAVEVLQAHIKTAAAEDYEAVASAVAASISERIPGSGNARVPVAVIIRNANGESDPVTVLLDMTAILRAREN